VTFDEYLKAPGVNWSTLKWMRESPLHYKYRTETPIEDNDRLMLGRATHTAILEPDRFPLDYAVYDGGIRRGKEWEAFKAANPGRTLFKPEQYATCLAIRDAARGFLRTAHYLEVGEPERSVFWTDGMTGVKCKARIDWLHPEAIVDVKTCRSTNARQFGATAARYGYHSQLAFYVDGFRAESGELLHRKAVLIAAEAEAPHDVAVFVADPDKALWAGREEYRGLLHRVVLCESAGEWFGRYDEEQSLALPAWAFEEDGDGTDGLTFGEEAT
jgi:hypothetical protein